MIPTDDKGQNGRHTLTRIVSAANVKTIKLPIRLSDLLVKVLHLLILVRNRHALQILAVSDSLEIAAY